MTILFKNKTSIARTFFAVKILLLTLTMAGVAFTQDKSGSNLIEPAAERLGVQNAPYDFDGDSKTDIAIYRRQSGEWWNLKSADGGNSAAQFGAPNTSDFPVPADFTGDGIADRAFYRNSTGEWFVLRSEDFSYYSFPFGTGNDFPITGDFDGDGTSDPGVFRASSSPGQTMFYILKSTGGVTIESFGSRNDAPVIEDYDGDGKDDIAIYRWSEGEWWINRSSGGVVVYQFGIPSLPAFEPNRDPVENTATGIQTIVVPADYTGDGKADLAYFTNSGDWYVLRSEDNSFYSFPFGNNEDYPVIGDYDGDGIYDPGVFRLTTNTWYMLQSTDGFKAVTFGQNGDYPLSSYRLAYL